MLRNRLNDLEELSESENIRYFFLKFEKIEHTICHCN